MISKINLTSFDGMLRDHFALPGTRLKQYVVDGRRETQWENETCPRVFVFSHTDNTGAACRNSGQQTLYTHLDHDCCGPCNDFAELIKERPEIREWLELKAKRPPIEQDTSKLSDEYAAEWLRAAPALFAFIKKQKP